MVASAHKARTTTRMQFALVCLLWLSVLYCAHADVLISGVDSKTRNNILAYLQLDEETCDSPEWRIRRLFSDAETEIREALEVVGYYNVDIEKKLEAGDACWQASFAITPGQPVILRTVSIEINTGGTQDAELESAAQECALHSGDALQQASYDSCTRRIARIARERGYFDADFIERRIDVYPDVYAADITLHFATGRRYVFGVTTFDQVVLNPDLIRRFVNITPGEPYDATLVRRLQRDLVTSAYFDQVVFKRAPRGEPHFDVPIHVKLTPGKKISVQRGHRFLYRRRS